MRPVVLLIVTLLLYGCRADSHPGQSNAQKNPAEIAPMQLSQWQVELENGGDVAVRNGVLEINVPAGCTVWYRSMLKGPVSIEYDVTNIKAGGQNDRVSDMNCFWMAQDARSMEDLLGYPRTGKFADYNQLKCYYVGYGGNSNTTTRFRRYIGSATTRPLLPEHDLTDPKFLLIPNHTYHIRLVASGPTIQYWRDGEKIFDFNDPSPYTRGWFAFRTVTNHMKIANFQIGSPQ